MLAVVFLSLDTGGIALNYKNGRDVLPAWLLDKLQEYVQGELVYIPRKGDARAGWGTVNGTRLKIELRNMEICRLYETGVSVVELTEKFHLSEDSIRKVVSTGRRKRDILLCGKNA